MTAHVRSGTICDPVFDVDTQRFAEYVRVGALILGAERIGVWRPMDDRLRVVVVTLAEVVEGSVDVRIVFDVLKEIDPQFAWSVMLHEAMAAYDRFAIAIDRAARLAEAKLLVDAAVLRAGDAWEALAKSLDDLGRATTLASATATLVAQEVDRDG